MSYDDRRANAQSRAEQRCRVPRVRADPTARQQCGDDTTRALVGVRKLKRDGHDHGVATVRRYERRRSFHAGCVDVTRVISSEAAIPITLDLIFGNVRRVPDHDVESAGVYDLWELDKPMK